MRKSEGKTLSAIAIAFREDTKTFDETDGVFNKVKDEVSEKTASQTPVCMVLIIDGNRMKIDSVDKAGNDVMFLDLDAKGDPPIFIVRPAPFVRRRVVEAQTA